MENGARDASSEVARLTAQWRLTLGVAHTLNNALAAILGEASFLLDDRKDDAELVESCQLIQHEVERCARLTRALLGRPDRAADEGEPADLGRLLADWRSLLPEALSRRFEPVVKVPEALVLVPAPRRDLESLILLLAHRCCEQCPEGGRLSILLDPPSSHRATLRLELLRDPTADPVWRSPEAPFDLGEAQALMKPHGATVEVERSEGGLRLTVSLPCAPDSGD